MNINPYQILKIDPNSEPEEIKKAYRKLVKIHHPDKGGDPKAMLEINAAWEILKKKNKNLNERLKVDDVSNYSKNYSRPKYKNEKSSFSNSTPKYFF